MTEKKGPWWRKYTKRHIEEEPSKPAKKMEGPSEKPFEDMRGLQGQVDKTFKELFRKDLFRTPEMPRIMKMEGGQFRKPYVRVKETDKDVIVRVEVPGVKKEDIKIKVEGQNLIIDAKVSRKVEKKEQNIYRVRSSYKGFRNVIRLPAEVDKKQSKAKYHQGVLTVILPKKYPGEGPSDIDIE